MHDHTEPEEVSSATRRVYRIGANFCLERDAVDQTVTIRCGILSGDPTEGIHTTFPFPNRTWTYNDIRMAFSEFNIAPMFEDEFLMSGNKAVFTPGLIDPTALDIVFSSGNIVLDTEFFNLSMAVMAPPGIDESNFRDIAFQELLGNYSCTLANPFGTDSATSVVRECGKAILYRKLIYRSLVLVFSWCKIFVAVDANRSFNIR